MTGKQLVTRDEAEVVKKQPSVPCSDCPFRRTSLAGWLGGSTPEEYRRLAHSDTFIECHAVKLDEDVAECVGAAIYRANVAKMAPPGCMKVKSDRMTVFATPMEFISHHGREAK